MNKFTIQTENNRSSLIYALQSEETIDTFSLGMLTENRIPGLAETSFTQVDAQKYIIYNITARIPARQLFAGPVNKQRILRVFEGITSALMSAEEYMIPFSSLILDLDLIYCNVMNAETVLICLPLLDVPAQNDPNTFMKSILFNTQFDQSENCDYVTTLINYLNTHPSLQLAEFRRLLLEMERAPKEIKPTDSIPGGLPRKQPDVPKSVQQQVQQPVQQPIQHPVQLPVQQPIQRPVQQPVQQPVNPPVQRTAQPPVQPGEKPMSMLYLLRNYSKENKAIYDAQHKAADGGKSKKKPEKQPRKKKENTSEKKGKSGTGKKSASFQVPGMFEREEYRPGQIPMGGVPAQVVQQPVQQSIQQPVQMPVQQPVQQQAQVSQPAYAAAVPQGGNADFGDTDYFTDGAGGSETVLMGMESAPVQKVGPYLLRTRNNERIPLDKPVFRLGRETSGGAFGKNDYVIADNPYVGNSHAVIMTRNEEYFLIDSNSQNHSFLNGEQLLPGGEARLTHGARFSLANEEFEFRLY